jgi:periplasmic protein TonB
MASSEGLAPRLPDTLPEDFGGWDNEESSKAAPGDSSGLADVHAFGEATKPHGQSAEREAVPSPATDRPRDRRPVPSAPDYLKQQKLTSELLDGPPSRASQKIDASREWETDVSPSATSSNSNGYAAPYSFGEPAKPRGQSAERETMFSPAVDRPRDTRSAPSTSDFLKPQKSTNGSVDAPPSRASKIGTSHEWETDVSPSAAPGDTNGYGGAYSFGEPAKPRGQSAEREATMAPTMDRSRDTHPSTFGPEFIKQQMSSSGLVEELPSPATHRQPTGPTTKTGPATKVSPAGNGAPAKPSWPEAAAADGTRNSREVTATELTATEIREADEALYQLFSTKPAEVTEEQKPTNKKWIVVGAIGACSIVILLIVFFTVFHHGAITAAKQSVQPSQEAADTSEVITNVPKPSASEPLNQNKPQATAQAQQTTNNQPNQPTNDAEATASAPTLSESQTKAMNDQLNAPSRIPQGIKKQGGENEPPPASLGAAAAEGLGGGGANTSFFNGHGQPVVKAAPTKPLAISAGVATGMLIHQSAPIYPPIAKAARVSGTVELQATISKVGTITDLHVVSGPAMLRQAAVDAVRTWRYKPYKLNNEATEVETTINVNFTLGG